MPKWLRHDSENVYFIVTVCLLLPINSSFSCHPELVSGSAVTLNGFDISKTKGSEPLKVPNPPIKSQCSQIISTVLPD